MERLIRELKTRSSTIESAPLHDLLLSEEGERFLEKTQSGRRMIVVLKVEGKMRKIGEKGGSGAKQSKVSSKFKL